MRQPEKHQVGENIEVVNAGWTFEGIAEDFDEHVQRSVPLYDEGHELVCQLSDFFMPPNATVIELGTSTGVLAEKFLKHAAGRKDIRYVAYDNVSDMLARAELKCGDDDRVSFENADIVDVDLPKSTMVISYYTMQFLHPRVRQHMFDKIYESLEWGGAFVLFEKVRGPDARFQDLAMQIYHEFKITQGFDEVEILNKQRSLKGVLEPFSTQGNIDLLKRAGFTDIWSVMKYVCFEGFVAIK